jgi:hypothetical protein
MKRLIKVIALISTLALTLIAGILIHGWLFEAPVWLSTSSPNKTYTVELTGDKGRGGFIFDSTVRFNVIRNGQPLVKDVHAHSGDFMDISFELAYPENVWVNENVIRFWRTSDVIEHQADTLLILNNTDKVIRYLKINAKDMFLVFDMQPHSSLRLSTSHQSWLGWIACEGEFVDGQPISWDGVNFFHQDKLNVPLQYCVAISEGEIKIESPQIEGYNSSGSGDNPNIPKAMNCNP